MSTRSRSPLEASTERLEVELEQLRAERERMRADWAALLRELGNPPTPNAADLEALIAELPPRERQSLRRFHEETAALVAPRREHSALAEPRLVPSIAFNRSALRA